MSQFVFIHGGGQGSWVWRNLTTVLTQRYAVAPQDMLTLDVPGCVDKLDWDTTALSFSDLIQAQLELMTYRQRWRERIAQATDSSALFQSDYCHARPE